MATSLRVLIVEDNPIDAELMLRELRRDGFEPVWRRVESADDFAGALSPELDVVLSDYSLPHFDALAALRVVEDSQLGLPFIVVSGAISEEVAVDCMKRGAADYILKDRLARLGQAVRHAMEAKKARDEQRRAEAALREHEASFRLLAERAHDVIFRYRLQPTPGLDFVSPAVSRTTGYSPEELYADPGLCSRIVLPEDRPTFHSLVLSGDSPQPVTLRIRHRNGHIVWLELTAVALRDDSGEPLGAEGIARDVTERMQAEEAVRTSEARFRAVFAQAAIGMALTDPRGRFLDTNPAFQAMLGYSGAELAGMLVDDITHPEDTVRESQLVRTVLTGQADHCQMEKRYIRKSGDVMRARLTVSMVRGKSPGEDLAIGLVEDITEWRLAETALKESQSLLASIYDTVPVGICVADEAGRFLEVNAAFSEIYGCPRVGLIGQHISRVLPGVPNGRLEAAFARLLCGNSNLLTEAQMRRHDGEVVDVAEASAMVVREDGHRVLITAVSDISDRKRTESALHETEERFRALFDRSLDGVYVHDFVGNFLDANDAALQMLGYAREDVSRLNFAALVAADQKPLLAQTMEELIETGTQREATVFRLRRADGVEVWVETKSSVIFHGDEPYAIQGIARDITERKLSETALRESEARFRAVFDNAAIGIAISDLEERVVEANPAHLRLMGYSVEELRGLRTADRVHAEDLPRTVDLLRGLVSGDHKHNQQQRRNIRKDGRPVWVNIIHSVIRDAEEKPRYVLGMVEDITTRREMEEQLQRAQRLEIAGRVAAQVAHDFNNLLVPVAGLPELIKMRLPQGDPAAAMCD
ncbi:MAG: PAS domain S-box protein, partial [Chloroflexi bacterium]|nr:PAS domain S-box protein [Chloroflexota bacterium]